MHQFNEHHLELKGFSAFYETEILPKLARDEAGRALAQKKMYRALWIICIAMVFAIAFAVYIHAALPVHVMLPITITVMGGIMSMGTASHFIFKDIQSATKHNILSGICQFLGWSFQEHIQTPPLFETYVNLGLLPKRFTRSKFEDQISGTAHGVRFEFFEAHLENEQSSGKKTNSVTVFRGQLLSLEFNKAFAGRTVVLRDKGWLQGKKKQGMKRVGLVDPVFEDIFEAYGTDQVEARYLLTPTFMQRLVDLENSVDGSKIRFGFVEGFLLIAVETGNRYESGSMFEPLVNTGRTQKILDEIGVVYDVIDGVMDKSKR